MKEAAAVTVPHYPEWRFNADTGEWVTVKDGWEWHLSEESFQEGAEKWFDA